MKDFDYLEKFLALLFLLGFSPACFGYFFIDLFISIPKTIVNYYILGLILILIFSLSTHIMYKALFYILDNASFLKLFDKLKRK